MNFFICGFTGAGKSHALNKLKSVELSTQLGFYDLDELVQKQLNTTIASFIEINGIAKFREIETQELKKVLEKDNQLIALGGGAFNAETAEFLEQAIGFWIDTPFEECFRRIEGDKTRPMGQKSKSEVKTIYNQRLGLFKTVRRVEGFNEIANQIKSELENFT